MPNKSRWREYLTDEERAIIQKCDAAKASWLRWDVYRAGIVNRAIKRANYAEGKKKP